jgi:hypothetical protein
MSLITENSSHDDISLEITFHSEFTVLSPGRVSVTLKVHDLFGIDTYFARDSRQQNNSPFERN